MFKGGSTWRPPPMNPYTQGMPEHLIKDANFDVPPKEVPSGPKKGSLTDRLVLSFTIFFFNKAVHKWITKYIWHFLFSVILTTMFYNKHYCKG